MLEVAKKEDYNKNKSFSLGSPRHARWYLTRMFRKAFKAVETVTAEDDDEKEMYAETIIDTIDQLAELLSAIKERCENDNLTFYVAQQAEQLKRSLSKLFERMEDDKE